jgi:hypothetical protein
MDEKKIGLAQEAGQIVSRREAIGGTSPQALRRNILSLNRTLTISRKWLTKKRNQKSLAQSRLAEMERHL